MITLKNGEDQLVTFYLNKANKHDWGVIYMRLRVDDCLLRLSTNVRVKSTCWSKTEKRIILPVTLGDIDRRLHEVAERKLMDV